MMKKWEDLPEAEKQDMFKQLKLRRILEEVADKEYQCYYENITEEEFWEKYYLSKINENEKNRKISNQQQDNN